MAVFYYIKFLFQIDAQLGEETYNRIKVEVEYSDEHDDADNKPCNIKIDPESVLNKPKIKCENDDKVDSYMGENRQMPLSKDSVKEKTERGSDDESDFHSKSTEFSNCDSEVSSKHNRNNSFSDNKNDSDIFVTKSTRPTRKAKQIATARQTVLANKSSKNKIKVEKETLHDNNDEKVNKVNEKVKIGVQIKNEPNNEELIQPEESTSFKNDTNDCNSNKFMKEDKNSTMKDIKIKQEEIDLPLKKNAKCKDESVKSEFTTKQKEVKCKLESSPNKVKKACRKKKKKEKSRRIISLKIKSSEKVKENNDKKVKNKILLKTEKLSKDGDKCKTNIPEMMEVDNENKSDKGLTTTNFQTKKSFLDSIDYNEKEDKNLLSPSKEVDSFQTGPRTPEGPCPLSPDLCSKGPRTPEGPPPDTEDCYPSPRTPPLSPPPLLEKNTIEDKKSPSPPFRSRSRSPNNEKFDLCNPERRPRSPSKNEENLVITKSPENKESFCNDVLSGEISKPAPVKRKVIFLYSVAVANGNCVFLL